MKITDNTHTVWLEVPANQYPDVATPWRRTIRTRKVAVRYSARDGVRVMIEGTYVNKDGSLHPRHHSGQHSYAIRDIDQWPDVAVDALRHVEDTGAVPTECRHWPAPTS